MSIYNDIKEGYKRGGDVIKIIYANAIVFALIAVIKSLLFLLNIDDRPLLEAISLPSSFLNLLYSPWTLITYMFVHEEPLHILFNMLFLYWFGSIFAEYMNRKRVLNLYLTGGIAGAFTFILGINIFPVFHNELEFSYLYGASAAVISIVVALATYIPNYKVSVILIGEVKIKYIAAIYMFSYLIGLTGDNAGGELAHIGGAIWGYIYIKNLNRGRDIGSYLDSSIKFLTDLFKPRNRLKVKYKKRRGFKNSDLYEDKDIKFKSSDIKIIIDKISKSGYESLTEDEKITLFRSNNKN